MTKRKPSQDSKMIPPPRLVLLQHQQKKHAAKFILSLNKLHNRRHCQSLLRGKSTATLKSSKCYNKRDDTCITMAAAAAAVMTLSLLSSSNTYDETPSSPKSCQCETVMSGNTLPLHHANESSSQSSAPNTLSSGISTPRNVMVHRLRSLRGRNLNEKYKVDWNTVLGEGAYGSVHPARLAATGEKVRQFYWIWFSTIQ